MSSGKCRIESLFEGVRHVFVVPDAGLQSLPLGVLVTKEEQGPFTDFTGYRHVEWLAKKFALTTLPSVSSLRALRTYAKRTRASHPFIGVGDPVLKGHPSEARSILASLFTSRGVADVNAVRQLPALPETSDELNEIAKSLGAGSSSLFLRERANEQVIKGTDLSNAKVLAFATHGLVTGDLKGLAEPALALTPPEKGSELDDGLLTASEVAKLKLNADLVVLSACNTASPDGTPGAEALSGLAKAFFYAGSRALLVSHWPVMSDAAVKLTTGMLHYRAKNPTAGRAEALRRSMLALMNNEEKPHYAHPLFWAPFVVVGEGGTYAAN
jgi:CHAT domain-containing protein